VLLVQVRDVFGPDDVSLVVPDRPLDDAGLEAVEEIVSLELRSKRWTGGLVTDLVPNQAVPRGSGGAVFVVGHRRTRGDVRDIEIVCRLSVALEQGTLDLQTVRGEPHARKGSHKKTRERRRS